MIKIVILSEHYGKSFRGAEIWAKTLKEKLKSKFDMQIFSDVFGSLGKWSKADIVISIDGRLQVFGTRILTWLNGKPLVVFGHSGLGADDKWNLLCSPDIFVAFSSFQKNWAEKFKLPWTRVVLIPHAIDTQMFYPARKKSDKKIVLCVAANDPAKRIDLIKRAVDLIPDATFMVVGKGNPIEAKYSDMPDVYRKASVFCFTPNPWESFGLVFLEAMASNLPIVTTNDPIRREIVGNAGILVDDPENPKELANAIETALKTDWGDKPRKQAEKFSWDKIAEKYEELFRSLIKK